MCQIPEMGLVDTLEPLQHCIIREGNPDAPRITYLRIAYQ